MLTEKQVKKIAPYEWQAKLVRNTRYYYSGDRVMHRMLLEVPDRMVVDHINGNGLDNHPNNLRICTRAQNSKGQHARRGVSKYKGPVPSGNKWAVYIRANYRSRYLGTYDTEAHAALAYDVAAYQVHGEYAQLNFPCLRLLMQDPSS